MQPACSPLTEAQPTMKNAKDSIARTHHPPGGATHRLSPSPSVFRPESVWRPSPIECADSPHTDSGRNTDWHRDDDAANGIHAALCSLCSLWFMPVSVRSSLPRLLRANRITWGETLTIVSIRAPVRTPGRPVAPLATSAFERFQSAPRCGHRGDQSDTAGLRHSGLFQSAPRCGHRGDRPGSDTSTR